ncbi:MAG: 16S rRNA (adenine(1518)-N(6)/adenine(1519)-N(6))-dimethyltransferase [bacterium]|nr:16S rRNA (adenine(1518)-N(6)/adenine(1519)-N(6))-dimethyltransferase [bacterium]
MRPKKSLGQNFLTSEAIAEEIVGAGGVGRDDTVLEAGPGKGILTEILLKKAGRVIAVEKDRQLVYFLQEKFADSENLEIVYGDILKFNPKDRGLGKGGYKIIANIPYYITSFFLRKFLESDSQPSKMVLMVQKEVAERIVGLPGKRKNGRKEENPLSSITGITGNDSRKRFSSFRPVKESILSISVKAYGEPKIIKIVPAGCFSPPPKVDSAVLLIDNISKDFFTSGVGTDGGGRISEEKFFEILKRGFSEKRKMLKNNLPEFTEDDFAKCGIPPKARAENLSPENWRCLASLETKK